MANHKSTVSSRYILTVGISSFFLAIIFTFFSETFASKLNSLILSLIFLIIILLINILSDVLGTAVTAASDAPLNAKAAKRVRGASHGLKLIRNADKVANLANDVVGDIATTVSGALGISIALQVMSISKDISQFWLNVLITAFIAAVIVSSKAFAKKIALTRPEEVVFWAGRILAKLEDVTGITLFPNKKRGSGRARKD